jgi:hypothetical protein
MHIGDVGIEEPMWVYLSFMRRAQREQWFIEHPVGIREITALTLVTPVPLRSKTQRERRRPVQLVVRKFSYGCS